MGFEAIYVTPLSRGSQGGAAASCAVAAKRSLKVFLSDSAPAFKGDKLAVAAILGGVALERSSAKEAALIALHGPSARSCVLVAPQGTLTQSNAALRYLANVAPAQGLYGETAFDEGVVDQWLEFSTLEIEVAVAAKLASPKSASVSAAAQADVFKALAVLNGVLKTRTFLVTNLITIADIAMAACLAAAFDAGLLDVSAFAKAPNAMRWLLTCLHQPSFIAVCGPPKISAPAAAKAKAAPAKASAKAPAAAVSTTVDPASMFSPAFSRGRIRVKELLAAQPVGAEVTVKGWVRTFREAEKGATAFVELNDGSCMGSMQIVCSKQSTKNFADLKNCGGAGSSLSAIGIVVESRGAGQTIEVQASEITVLGATRGGDNREPGAKSYPLAKKFHTLEHLRTHAHLRPRARFGSAVVRVRHALAFATHEFFNKLGFLYVHTPLITASDCEGAGEQFTVTTLLGEGAASLPTLKDGTVDYSKDFFGKKAGLTVSGQLNVETHAAALSDCYTFGPTFRAENSHTSRHLAEFWMIEPEVSFADIHDDIKLAQDYLKYCVASALSRCDDDLEFFETLKDGAGLRQRLRDIVDTPFTVLEYTAAIELLQKEIVEKGAKFENMDVVWGMDLGSEHERYLTDVVYKAPVVLVNYPKDIKAFYMKLNPDGKTVAAMDMLVPKIGELIGGSQREDHLETLEERCRGVGIDPASLSWYLELRQYGSVPHAGFGLGFERLVMLVTGVENIRDVIPFPRYPGHCAF
ncbi:hypothetical protein M885DRAFT_514170 [Pelagophyceae sp. CCMP2097]|nr:hypothetical protein M885DRAFT_514170 [Pelagophyceae sp. CCMP2097]